LPHSCCRLVSFISSTYLICCLSCLFACIPNTKVTTAIPRSSYLHFNSQNHSSFIALYTLKHLDSVINDPSSVYFVCIACFTVTQWLLRTHHHGHSYLRNHTLFTYHISFILSLSYITINPFKISFLQHTQLSWLLLVLVESGFAGLLPDGVRPPPLSLFSESLLVLRLNSHLAGWF